MATSPLNLSSFSGGSGIDTKAIVDQLMQIERQPLLNLQQKEASYQAAISAYGTLLSNVSSLESGVAALINPTTGTSATASDSTFFTATGSSTGVPGTYSVQISNIASAQSLYSPRFGSQTATVADLSTYATQRLKIQVGTGTAKEIYINSTNNTLSGIRDAINNAQVGATAAIVKETGNFIIDGNTNTIVFNDGIAFRTATINTGTYTGADLAAAVQSALNTAPGTTNTFTVDYNSTSPNRFTIKNSSGPAVSFKFGDPAVAGDPVSNAGKLLGFSPANSGNISAGGSFTGTDSVDGTYKLTITSASGAANTIKMLVDKNNDGTYEDNAFYERNNTGLSSLASNATFTTTLPPYTVASGYSNLSQSQPALDAKLKVNGLELFRSTNSISDAITGVTLNLLKGDGYSANLTLTVAADNSALSNKLSSFVATYNATMAAIDKLRGNKDQRGVLSGDTTLSSLKNLLRTVTTTIYGNSTTNNTLTYLGITHDKTGALSLDTSKLNAAVSDNSSNVINIINAMANSLDSSLKDYKNTTIPGRQDGYRTRIKNTRNAEGELQRSLDIKEKSLRTRYMALDNLLNQLQGTSNYLTQQMNTLGKSFGGSNG